MQLNLVYSILNVFVSTLFPIIVFPYIARVLGAEGIGEYNFYSQAITYLALFSSFGINIYGVREIGKFKDNIIKRSQIAIELFSINFLNAIVIFFALLFFVSNSHYSADFYTIVLLSTILFSNAIAVEWFFVGVEFQKYILIRGFIVKIISLGFIFFFVKSKEDLINYILVVILGLFIPALFNFYNFIKMVSLKTLKKPVFKFHFKFLISIFLVETSFRYFGMADTVILGLNEPKVIVGYYSLALSVFSIVSSFIRVSAITLLPRASYFLNFNLMDDFAILINNTIKFILFIGVPFSIGMFIWSDFIVNLLGGDGFEQSAVILKFFAPLLIVSSLINMLIFQILYPQNQIKSIIISLIIGILLNLFLNFFLIPIYSSIGVVISSLISQLTILLILVKSNKNFILSAFFSNDMFVYIYAGITLMLSIIILNYIFESINIIIQFIVGIVCYLVALLYFKEYLFINYMLKWLKI